MFILNQEKLQTRAQLITNTTRKTDHEEEGGDRRRIKREGSRALDGPVCRYINLKYLFIFDITICIYT